MNSPAPSRVGLDSRQTLDSRQALETLELLLFEVDQVKLAVLSRDVREVLRMARLSPAPRAPAMVEGALKLRQRVYWVYDLRAVLEFPRRDAAASDHLILIDLLDGQAEAPQSFALRVDYALDLVQVAAEDLFVPQDGQPQIIWRMAKANQEIVYVLDLRQL